jgi:hypothetical protein
VRSSSSKKATPAPSIAALRRASWCISSPPPAIPIFNLTVPASRIVGGYTVKDGCIIPNYSHSEVIEAVFKRTRVTVALMTSAKLLSAVEPVIRYQRGRFRGSEQAKPGSLRYELGIQQRQDALHRLAGLWAIGEAGAALGFATARLYDELDPLEREKDAILAQQGVPRQQGGDEVLPRDQQDRARTAAAWKRARRGAQCGAYEELKPTAGRVRAERFRGQRALSRRQAVEHRHGSNAMREALSLMGGYGITEDCPGFLAYKWMDSQLEATYEGPEAVQRRNLSVTMTTSCSWRSSSSGSRDAQGCRAASGNRRLHTGHRDAALAVDVSAPAGGDRRRWRRSLSQRAPGRDLPAGRCLLLAAGFARSRCST